MRLFKRKKKRVFTLKPVTDVLSVKGRRTLRMGGEQFYVFRCGTETVVYQGNNDIFNSARDGITFEAWKKKYKREKGIID